MITAIQAVAAASRFKVLRYFPADESGIVIAEVAKLLCRMVSTPAQLDWLVQTMIDQAGEWQGPTELRGVYCSRFKPADGIEADCLTTPGFTAVAAEMRAITTHEEKKELTEQGTRQLQKLLDPSKFELP